MLPDVSIVLYHNISANKCPLTSQLGISTRPEVFRKHIEYYKKNFDFISEDDLLSGRLPRKALLVTFDDAYRSVLNVAAPLLKEVNAPSIFFIIPSTVQTLTLPIDNVLSLAVEELGMQRVVALMDLGSAMTSSVGELISRFISKMTLGEIALLKERLLAALGTTEAAVRELYKIFLEPNDMRRLADYGVSVGNHSMTQSHFRMLSAGELGREIEQSRSELEKLSGQSVRSLSVPYGSEIDATDNAITVTRNSGHKAIFLVQARSNHFRTVNDIYYRVSLRNEEVSQLWLRVCVFPIIRSFRDSLIIRSFRGRLRVIRQSSNVGHPALRR